MGHFKDMYENLSGPKGLQHMLPSNSEASLEVIGKDVLPRTLENRG